MDKENPINRWLFLVVAVILFTAIQGSWVDCPETPKANFTQHDVNVSCTYEVPSGKTVKQSYVKFPVGESNPVLYNRTKYTENATIYTLSKNGTSVIQLDDKKIKSNGKYELIVEKDGNKVKMTLHIDQIYPQTLRPYEFYVDEGSKNHPYKVVHLQRDPKGMSYKDYVGSSVCPHLSFLGLCASLIMVISLH